MHKIFYLTIFIIIHNVFGNETLTQYADGTIHYYRLYESNEKKYGINFPLNNPSKGTVGEIGTWGITAVVENDKIKCCRSKAFSHDSTSPEAKRLLEIYTTVKKEFKIKEQNNTLPPIQQKNI